jgi:putative flippase GtrA
MNNPNQTSPPHSPPATPNSPLPWSERRETAKQIRRFLVIGVLSVLTDFAVYTLLTHLGLLTSLSKGVSYLAGMVVGFIGNKLWTFESARRSAAEPVIYIVLYTITLGVNVLVNSLGLLVLDDWLALESAKGLAFLAATGVTTVLNFIGMKWVTFRVGVRQRRRRVETEVDRGQALAREQS